MVQIDSITWEEEDTDAEAQMITCVRRVHVARATVSKQLSGDVWTWRLEFADHECIEGYAESRAQARKAVEEQAVLAMRTNPTRQAVIIEGTEPLSVVEESA